MISTMILGGNLWRHNSKIRLCVLEGLEEAMLQKLKDTTLLLPREIAQSYFLFGGAQYEKGKYKEASKNLENALNAYKKIEDTATESDIALVLYYLAESLRYDSQYKASLQRVKESMEYCKGKDPLLLAKCYETLTCLERQLSNIGESIPSLKEILKMKKNAKADALELAYTYHNLARNTSFSEDPKLAI